MDGDRNKTILNSAFLFRKLTKLFERMSKEYDIPKISPVNRANGKNVITNLRFRKSPPTIIEYVKAP